MSEPQDNGIGSANGHRAYRLSFFTGKKDNRAKRKTLSWPDLTKMVESPQIRETKDGELFSPAVFDRDKRAKENVKELSALMLDHDHQADFERDTKVWTDLGYAVIAYTTFSHLRPPDKEVKFRIFLPLTEPIPRDDYALLWRWAAAQSPSADPSAKDSSRMFYTPARAGASDEDAPYQWLVKDGNPLDWRSIVESEREKENAEKAAREEEREQLRIAREQRKNERRKADRHAKKDEEEREKKRIEAYVMAALDGECDEVAGFTPGQPGGRVGRLFKAACRLGSLLHFNVVTYMEAFNRLNDAARACGISDSEAQRNIKSGLHKGEAEPAEMPEGTVVSLDAYRGRIRQVFGGPGGSGIHQERIQFPAAYKQDYHKLSSRVWHAIADLEKDAPFIFRHVGALVRCAPKTIKGHQVLAAEPLSPDMLMSHLIHTFDWVDVDPKTYMPIASYPPPMLAKVMLSDTEDRIPVKPPELIMIAHAPVFARDGRLIDKPGFDRDSGVFYLPNDDFGEMPVDVTPEDVEDAKKLILDDLLGEFPFSTEADKHNAVGMLITMFVRQMISGRVPAFLAEASVQGAGKGTLLDACLRVAYGRGGGHGLTTYTTNEEEMRKEMTTHLVECRGAVVIDNLVGEIKSATLAAVLTADVWTQRLLGANKTSEVTDPQTIWLLTGNNPSFSQDNTRRIIPIRLTPNTDRPELREFKNPLFIDWVLKNRVALVRAVIVLVRNWQKKNSPKGGFTLNSYVDHSQKISGILEAAELGKFGQNLLTFSERADTERNVRAIFCNAWFQEFHQPSFDFEMRSRRATASEILKTVGAKIEGLPLSGETEKARITSFGKWLEKSEGVCPQYVGLNWDPVADPDAPASDDEKIDQLNESRWGKPVNVRRSFKITRDGQRKGCTAWVILCVESEGPQGPLGPPISQSVGRNKNAPAGSFHAEDACESSHEDAGAFLHVSVEPAGGPPTGPRGPSLSQTDTLYDGDYPMEFPSDDPNWEPQF